jgi:hypothetical protein
MLIPTGRATIEMLTRSSKPKQPGKTAVIDGPKRKEVKCKTD